MMNEGGGACSRYGERLDSYRACVGRLERKRRIGKLRSKWEDNFKIYFEELWWRNKLDWSGSGEG